MNLNERIQIVTLIVLLFFYTVSVVYTSIDLYILFSCK